MWLHCSGLKLKQKFQHDQHKLRHMIISPTASIPAQCVLTTTTSTNSRSRTFTIGQFGALLLYCALVASKGVCRVHSMPANMAALLQQ
jgi:hypothetical protein